MSVLGSCHCGNVRIELPSPPEWVADCNCSLCRRTAWRTAYFPPDEVRISGETKAYVWAIGRAPALAEIAAELEALADAHFVLGPEGRREEHVAEANAFFLALAQHAAVGDPLVEDAVALLEAAHGGIRIAEICDRLGTGPRRLNRRFRHIVGVNPKFFGQILQVNWVVGLLYANDAATLTELAHEAGFHD